VMMCGVKLVPAEPANALPETRHKSWSGDRIENAVFSFSHDFFYTTIDF